MIAKLYELKQLEDLSFVKDAEVIGLTTSGAAKQRVLLESLEPKIGWYSDETVMIIIVLQFRLRLM